jgi:hypothetical protein
LPLVTFAGAKVIRADGKEGGALGELTWHADVGIERNVGSLPARMHRPEVR